MPNLLSVIATAAGGLAMTLKRFGIFISMTPGRFGIQDRKPVIGLENNFSFIIYNYAFSWIVREKLCYVRD